MRAGNFPATAARTAYIKCYVYVQYQQRKNEHLPFFPTLFMARVALLSSEKLKNWEKYVADQKLKNTGAAEIKFRTKLRNSMEDLDGLE